MHISPAQVPLAFLNELAPGAPIKPRMPVLVEEDRMPVLIEDDSDDENIDGPHEAPAPVKISRVAADRKWGYNGNLFETSERTTTDLHKAINISFTQAVQELVHANSHHQLNSITERYLKTITEPIDPPHVKLQRMTELADSGVVKSIITLLHEAKDKARFLQILSCLTTDFTLFFLNKHFKLNISSYKWSKANVYQKLFEAGGDSSGWNYDSVRSFRQHHNTNDLDVAFAFMTCVDQISHQASRTHYVKDNKGFLHELPGNIRRYNLEESYRLYCLHIITLPANDTVVNAISKEKYKEMLSIVAPQTEMNLAALDSVYVKCGIENFDALRELVNFTCRQNPSSKHIHELITYYEEYLKNGLKKHLSDDSNCKTHSFCHLIGGQYTDSDTPEFCSECNNETLIIENLKLSIMEMKFVVRSDDGSLLDSDEPGEGDPESRSNLYIYLEKLKQYGYLQKP